jgi:hypothetical protein
MLGDIGPVCTIHTIHILEMGILRSPTQSAPVGLYADGIDVHSAHLALDLPDITGLIHLIDVEVLVYLREIRPECGDLAGVFVIRRRHIEK